jgi:hypothetical protein
MATTRAQKTSAAEPGLKLRRRDARPPVRRRPLVPIVAGAWLAAAVIGVLLAPRTARRLGAAPMSREGISRVRPDIS